ncbi:MAG: hypothetical protein A2Y17_10945 [Clostridiales bacterium GWF2_38_85]|nr:MAG: hypothetical protein A2Y17_10945 [Clostridiales bacterium GWF2_38_85]
MNRNPYKFFIITYIWTWGLLAIPIIFNLNYSNIITKMSFYIAGAAPSAVALILVFSSKDKEYIKSFFNRLINFRLINLKSYIFIFTFIPTANIVATSIYSAIWNVSFNFNPSINNLFDILMFAFFMLLFGPLAEELGWRGYALDKLTNKYNIIKSCLLISVFWALWHAPMFLINGTYQNSIAHQSWLLIVDFFIAIIANSFIMTIIYIKNNKSILSGILYHFNINFFGELFDLNNSEMFLRTLIQVVISIILIGVLIKKDQLYDKKTA